MVELDNARTADPARPAAMLRALQAQSGRLSNRFAQPVAVKVVFDPLAVPPDHIDTLLRESGIADATWLDVALLPSPHARYYEQKNIGAQACQTDVVLLVDSDIIPEEGWLEGLLESFAEPDVSFVFGETRIETSSLYEKCYALVTESFPHMSASGPALIDQTHFLANAFAFKTGPLGNVLFPASDAFRGQCALASDKIRRTGHQIYLQKAAKARHPAPQGTRLFFANAFGAGFDEVAHTPARVSEGFLGRLKASPIGSVYRLAKSCLTAWSRCLTQYKVVVLPVRHVPTAMTLAGVYYTVRFAGEIASFISPGFVRTVGDH